MFTTIDIPTSVWFGEDARLKISAIASTHRWKRLLFVLSSRMVQRPFASSVLDALQANGVSCELWTGVSPNPRLGEAQACIGQYARDLPDAVVGFGGGSAMDLAKAIAVGLSTSTDLKVILRGEGAVPKTKLPLVLVPTTAGSGAEVSFGAILSDEGAQVKRGLRSRAVAADYALVDPVCTFDLPRGVTMTTGFDVITHALETFLSNKRSRYTAMLSQYALTTTFQALEMLVDDLENRHARVELSYASLLAGVNLALASTCLPHRLQYPVGGLTDTPHADGLAALYPAWLRASLPYATDDLAVCAEWIGVSEVNGSPQDQAQRFVAHLCTFMDRIGMQRRLGDFGLGEASVQTLVEHVEGNLGTDPGDISPAALTRIYTESL